VIRLGVAALAVAALLSPSLLSADELVAPATRDVSPPGITPSAPADGGPLIRVPVPPPPPPPPRWRRFFLPATSDAATFLAGQLTIRIAGVSALPADATCTLSSGATWPCGQTALYSFRRFLHGRAVECYMAPPTDGQVTVTAPCRIGPIDLASWLLTAGWAKPASGDASADAAAAYAAACAGIGIWRGTPPPSDCPPTAPDTGG